MHQIDNNALININKIKQIDSGFVLSDFKEVICYMSKYGSISISKKDQEILSKSNDYLNYSKSVFNNKINANKFKKIIALEVFKIISIAITLIAMFINIENVVQKSFNELFYFYIASFIFMYIILIWHSIVYDNKGWLLWGKHKIEAKNKSYLTAYFVSEYLKCKYEVVKKIKLSTDRIEDIKGNFNSAYYKLETKDKKSFINKNRTINKNWNDNNYIEKSNEFLNILNSNIIFTIFVIVLSVIFVIMTLNIFLF